MSTSRSSPFSIYFSRISAIRELCITIYAQRVKTRHVNNKVGGVIVTSLHFPPYPYWKKNPLMTANGLFSGAVLESATIMIRGTGSSPRLLVGIESDLRLCRYRLFSGDN